jgi:hypothetical protein
VKERILLAASGDVLGLAVSIAPTRALANLSQSIARAAAALNPVHEDSTILLLSFTRVRPPQSYAASRPTLRVVGYGALFSHQVGSWRDLFNADFDVLLHDLTSTYFEVNASDLAEGSKRRHGHSRDKPPDCPQVVIALVVTPDGLPLAYEVLPGNTSTDRC